MFSQRFPIYIWMAAFIGILFLPVSTSAELDSAETEPNPVEKIEVQIFSHVSNADALQIRRLLT